MISPVICAHCGKKYDLAAVVPVTRYADCTTFKTPCCGKMADDRRFTGAPDFYDEAAVLEQQRRLDEMGMFGKF